jgi:tetratricopeptide (TPR) repeat protein/CHAT domain-containing protein
MSLAPGEDARTRPVHRFAPYPRLNIAASPPRTFTFTITVGLLFFFLALQPPCHGASRAEQLLGEAKEAYSANNYQNAISKLQEALKLAGESGDKKTSAECLTGIAEIYINLGRYEEAISAYEQLLAVHGETNDTKDQVMDLIDIASLHANLGRYEEALKRYALALPIARQIGDQPRQAWLLLTMAATDSYLGRLDEAIALYEQAISIHKTMGDRRAEFAAVVDIGLLLSRTRRLEEALPRMQEALAIAKQTDGPPAEAWVLNNIGLAHENGGQFDKAVSYYQQALTIRTDLRDLNGQAETLTNLGFTYDKLNQLDKSLDAHKQARSIYTQTRDRVGEANSLASLGSVSEKLQQYETALDYYRQAVALYQLAANQWEAVLGLYRIGLLYMKVHQYEKALEAFNQALAVQKVVNDFKGQADTYLSIGAVYFNLSRYVESIKYEEQALELYQKIGDRGHEADCLANLGAAYYSMGQHEKALGLQERALAIHEQLGDRFGMGNDLGNIGKETRALGRFEKALGHYERALALAKEVGNQSGVEDRLVDIGVIYSLLGQYQLALNYYEEALKVHRDSGNHNAPASILANLGATYVELDQYDKALDYFEQALSMYREIGNLDNVATLLADIGSVHSVWRNFDKALDYFKQSLTLSENSGDRNKTGSILTNVGVAYSELGQYDKAYDSFKKSRDACLEVGDPLCVYLATWKLGSAEEAAGKDAEAVAHYEAALDTIEGMRTGLTETKNKTSFMANKFSFYDSLIEFYIILHGKDPSKGYDAKALEVFERKQGRIFLEEIGKSGARHFSGLADSVRDREADLENRSATVRATLTAERSKPIAQQDTALIESLGGQIREISASDEALRREIETNYPDYYALKYPKPAGVKDIQALLGPDEILLVYAVMEKFTCLWVVSQKNFAVYPRSVGRKQLEDKVSAFAKASGVIHDAISGHMTPREIRKIAAASIKDLGRAGLDLYAALIPKDISLLPGTYSIVQTGPLYRLPFEALVTSVEGEVPHYLVEDHAVTYLSSASLLRILREAQARRKEQARYPLLAFANPVYGAMPQSSESEKPGTERGAPLLSELKTRGYLAIMGGSFLELPETEDEVKEIKTILAAPDESRPLQLRKDDARSNVLRLNEAKKLEEYRYLIFAGHGVAPDEANQLTQPALVLSHPDPDGTDGFLTMADTFGLRLNANLVTLSACNTGRGNIVHGEGVMGLTRSFMYAGTQAVTVNLWSVESNSAKDLNTGFFENLKAGMGKAEALRQSKLHMIRGEGDEMYGHPFFWAPLVLFGDGR